LLCAIFLSVSINKVSRWKKQVNAYLNRLENCNTYEIRYDQNFFTVILTMKKKPVNGKILSILTAIMNLLQLKENTVICFPENQ
jgi:hypothetical protein